MPIFLFFGGEPIRLFEKQITLSEYMRIMIMTITLVGHAGLVKSKNIGC